MIEIDRREEIETTAGVEANRKVVFICHPLRNDLIGNIRRVQEICKLAYRTGVIPFAPHIYFTQFLNDMVSSERTLALAFDLEILRRCDELWVFGENLTEGMKGEIQFAKWIGVPIRSVNIDDAGLILQEPWDSEECIMIGV